MIMSGDMGDRRGITRGHSVMLRRESETEAMHWRQRLGKRIKKTIQIDGEFNDDDDANAQYCITAAPTKPRNWIMKIITCNGFLKFRRTSKFSTGTNPNHRLAMSLHWMFRVNFVFLFMAMCLTFFALVVLFSGFITVAGRMDPQCVRIGGDEFASSGSAFADAFALSWTTFSTVGYGSTYPALGHENNNRTNCFFINFICSLESLIGVLYSGFCGAILFGKVLRIQSHAQILFSDPLLLRYGSGVSKNDDDADEDVSSGDEETNRSPCPVLEFRIVNRLFNEPGGEIMDATINVVANINSNDADPAILEALEGGSVGNVPTAIGSFRSEASDESSKQAGKSLRSLPKILGSIAFSHRDHHAVDEDPSSRLMQHKHIFSKLMIEAPEHPFFKRCWVATHVLDEHSPIVKPRIRRLIRKNGGYWPAKLNSYSSIRESLQFNQILVSLNGVSNISASDVYAQKIYDWVDVNIGYQFVNILYRATDGSLGVDIDLLNDVREQDGGGGEPLLGDEEDDL